jgi:hypothetical protein
MFQGRSYSQVPRLQLLYMAYALSFSTICTICPTHISLLDCTTIREAYLEHSIIYEVLHTALIFMLLLLLSATRSKTQYMVFPRVKDHVKHTYNTTRDITALDIFIFYLSTAALKIMKQMLIRSEFTL